MKKAIFFGGLILGLLSMAIGGQPALADDVVNGRDSLGALVRTEPDFFEEGREMFEAEIDRLMQPAPTEPIFTIDEAAILNDDSFPELEQFAPMPQPEVPNPNQ